MAETGNMRYLKLHLGQPETSIVKAELYLSNDRRGWDADFSIPGLLDAAPELYERKGSTLVARPLPIGVGRPQNRVRILEGTGGEACAGRSLKIPGTECKPYLSFLPHQYKQGAIKDYSTAIAETPESGCVPLSGPDSRVG